MGRSSRNQKMKASTPIASPAQASGPRRRHLTPTSANVQVPPGTKQIDVRPLLETSKPGNPDAPFSLSKAIAETLLAIQAILPALISWGVTVALIFGGCCSNVRLFPLSRPHVSDR